MGVTGLWSIVQPCARPTKLETLNRKRLAVDASIWIYQFLKAVRDKEGNALRNSHVVGFFRRICKLLYFGIKPVFVFDGGAPVLKRQTVLGSKSGIWSRLAFEYRYRHTLPHRDIQERIHPAANVVHYEINLKMLNSWLSGGRMLDRVRQYHEKRHGGQDHG